MAASKREWDAVISCGWLGLLAGVGSSGDSSPRRTACLAIYVVELLQCLEVDAHLLCKHDFDNPSVMGELFPIIEP